MAKYLVVAHQTAGAPALAERIKAETSADPATEFVLLVPATPAAWLLGGARRNAQDEARRNMEYARDFLRSRGINVTRALVGYASPLAAMEEELRAQPGAYSAIFIATHPARISRWLKTRLPSRAERRFGLPVHHVIVEVEPSRTADPRRARLEDRLAAMEAGEISLKDLALDDVEVWEDVLGIAAARSRQGGPVTSLAEQLLDQTLTDEADSARLETAARSLEHRSRRVRRHAVKVLEKAPHRASRDAVQKALGDSDLEVRLGALRVLEDRREAADIQTLAQILARPSDPGATFASQALIRCGASAIPHLSALLESRNALVRWRATGCLGRIGGRQALPALLRAFDDQEPSVAWAAADWLAKMGRDVAADVLRHVLSADLTRVRQNALRHYAEQASPRRAFAPLIHAFENSAAHATIPVAIGTALETLSKDSATPSRRSA